MFSSGSSDSDVADMGSGKRVGMFSSSDSDEAQEHVAKTQMFSSGDEAPELVARCTAKTGHRAAGNRDTEPQAKVRKCEFQWASENHSEAARHLLHKANLASFSFQGAIHGVDYRWLMDAATLAASLTLEKHRVLWKSFLLHLKSQQEANALQCLRFTWYPMSDETPTPNKVTYGHCNEKGRNVDASGLEVDAMKPQGSLRDTDDTDDTDAELKTDKAIAKVMATRIQWSMALAMKPQGSLRDTDDTDDTDDTQHVIIRGTIPARMRPMKTQTGPVVRSVLADLTAVPEQDLVQSIFRDVHRVDSTDLHPSNLVALRGIAIDSPSWVTSHLRCSVHRSRTSELNALRLDADVDSFFMRTTLHLRGCGVMQTWRMRVRERAKHIVIKSGPLPEEVERWRETIVAPIRARVQCGHCSQNLVLKLVAWDTWFTGRTQNPDIVEHYHNSFCPRNDQLCARLCRREGCDMMLKAPPLYSRRSWHGQQSAVDEIILLVATHGFLLLSGAGARKICNTRATIGEASELADRPNVSVAPEQADRILDPQSQVHQDKAEQLKQEAEEHANYVGSFLRRPDHLIRMLRYREVLLIFAEVRGPMLHRAGSEWEMEQLLHAKRHGHRKYSLEVGGEAEDILHGMRQLTEVCQRSRSGYLWQGERLTHVVAPQSLPRFRILSFSMAARGGACLYDLGLKEQRRYLTRLFVLLNGSDEDADDICEDAELRPHLLDKISRAHVTAYPTAAALRSKESLVCLESQALILQESTQQVEHSHAGVKRGQRTRDQTHLEHVAMASAMRILQGERHDVAKIIPRRWRDDALELVARKRRARATSKRVTPKAKAKARAHGRKPRKKEQRPRKRSLRQAWIAMKVQGRLAGAEDHAAFERAILDPEIRRQCEQKAAELTALARLGHAGVGANASELGAPRRREDRRLRELREKARRLGARWDLRRARRVLEREDQQSYRPYRRRQLRTWRLVRKGQRDKAVPQNAELKSFSDGQVLPATLQPFAHALIPHPAHYADCAFWWDPDVRPEVLAALPESMATERLSRTSSWGSLHFCVDDSRVPVVPRPLAMQTQQHACWSYGVCLCFGKKNRTRLAFLQAFRQHLQAMLRKPSTVIQALRGPNEMREAADAGRLILSIQEESRAVTHYHHLSFARYKPLRPVLLRLEALQPNVGVDASELDARNQFLLRPARAPGGHWSFSLDCSAYAWVDLQKQQLMRLWCIEDVITRQDTLIIEARSFRRGDRLFWRGHAQKIPDKFPWEQPERQSRHDEEHEGDGSGDESSGTSGGEATVHDKSGVASEHAAVGGRLPQRSGSNQDWARPLVPGHAATGVEVLATVTKLLFGKVVRSATGEATWEARFSGNAGQNLAIQIDLRKVDSKLKQRTRSSGYMDVCEEHTAFRVVLLWLWRKWIMHTREQATLKQIPPHVRMCLEPLEQDELQPCPLCQAGQCKFMVDLPARLSKLIGRELSTSNVSSQPRDAVSGSVAAAPVTLAKEAAFPGDGVTAPVARASGVCCCCGAGNAKNQSGILICQHCGDVDMIVASAKQKVPRAMPMVARNHAALPVRLGATRENCDGGPGWEFIRIPGNGDCLFSSMAIGKLCLLQGKVAPGFHRRAEWGATARAGYLNHVDKLVARGGAVLGVASMETLVHSSTGMDLATYRRCMRAPDAANRRTWGGFLEASLMCQGWRCRVVFFVWEGGRPVVWSTIGGENVNLEHQHAGQIPLMWWGTHYDLLRLSPDILRSLQPA